MKAHLRRMLVAFGLVMAACVPPTPAEQDVLEDYEADREARNREHEHRTGNKHIYEGLYENPKAVVEYCGMPVIIDTGEEQWPADCYVKLEKIFWSRLKIHYRFTNWQEVGLWCGAYPNKCNTPKKLEFLVMHSNAKNSFEEKAEADEAALAKLRDDLEFGDQDCIVRSASVSRTAGSYAETTDTTSTITGTTTPVPGGGTHFSGRGRGSSTTSGTSQSTTVKASRTKVKCRTTPRD